MEVQKQIIKKQKNFYKSNQDQQQKIISSSDKQRINEKQQKQITSQIKQDEIEFKIMKDNQKNRSNSYRERLLITFLFFLALFFIIVFSSDSEITKNGSNINFQPNQKSKQQHKLQDKVKTPQNKIQKLNQINQKKQATVNIINDQNQNKQLIQLIQYKQIKTTGQIKNQLKIINKNQSQKYLQIPKQLFLFEQKGTSKLQQYMYQNIQRVAYQSGFKILKIYDSNIQPYLTHQNLKKLQNLVKKLKNKYNVNIKESLPSQVKKAFFYLIQLMNLYDNGGIMISDYFCLTQNLNWIKNITNDIHVRRGLDSVDPQVFAFFSLQHSSELKYVNMRAKYQIQKRVRLFPQIFPSIIVSKKGTLFLENVIDEIIQLLSNKNEQSALKGDYNYYELNKTKLVQNVMQFAAHRVLQRKQSQFDDTFFSSNQSILALDFYGLYVLSSYSGPRKIQRIFFADRRVKAYFQYLSRISIQQLQAYIGKFHIATSFYPIKQSRKVFETYMKNSSSLKIVRGSFTQKMLMPSGLQYFLIDDKQHRLPATKKIWDKLPKIIWLIWDKGTQKAPLSNQFCIQHIKKIALQSDFKVNIVTQKNLNEYLSRDIIKQIYEIKQKAKIQVFPQTISNIIRMVLIRQYGGVYMDSSTIALKKFDWIVNITNYPSEYIFNRYGQTPQVLMQYHPLFGSNYTWGYNQKYNTKQQWQFSYQNNFFAAIKGAKLIKEWIQVYKRAFKLSSYEEVKKMFKQCQMFNYSWGSVYLIAMDTLKCTIGFKNKQIKQKKPKQYVNVLDYYKVWTLNGFNGFQKNRQNFGIQVENKDGIINSLLYQYSIQYFESYVGPMFQICKIYGWFNGPISNVLKQAFFNNRTNVIHPQSLLAKYLPLLNNKIIMVSQDEYKIVPK